MKRISLSMVAMGIAVLVLFSLSWSQCPEDPIDLGACDTFYIEAWPNTDTCWGGDCGVWQVNVPGEHFPCFLYVNVFLTHDSNTFDAGDPWGVIHDSVSSITVPLSFWHEPVYGDADSVIFPTMESGPDQWNNARMDPPGHVLYSKSVFRHFEDTRDGDTVYLNRFNQMVNEEFLTAWTVTRDVDRVACSDDSGHVRFNLISGAGSKRWWEGSKEILFTLTFVVYMNEDETTEVCFDAQKWPPGETLSCVRIDAKQYLPRDNVPICFKVYADTVVGPSDVRWIDDAIEEGTKPTSFLLSQNYPNPFNPATNFKFTLPQACHVRIEIFNILGQRVRTLADEDMRAGIYVADWDGKDEKGADASSGIYFYRIKADEFSDIKRMVLLK
ncbi:hypothetical protein AMJ44_09230 [candidate division WOR-1 bacterium DG_54_3]|uniref:FlgD/Vpr Ig-like domain-containing protein n=1 Tax=candidate division WOR-1 bacterium DG_54_3 TaxID=1703775 RepID=A0A0S7XU21_UNCSA|nr:MAG: hypothetical protein AMJ44_09230 [candidate division WOR-1 bacterium DG_54_3]